jgi:beta-glucosidase
MPLDALAIVIAVQKVMLHGSPGCESLVNTSFVPFAPRPLHRSCALPFLALFHRRSVAHNVILAHAHAVKIYREQFKSSQKGVIGFTLNGDWTMPFDDSPESETRPLTLLCPDTDITLFMIHSVKTSKRLSMPWILQLVFYARLSIAHHPYLLRLGWYADPIYFGHYPPYMRSVIGDRLPTFTPEEINLVKGSSDFYGMNTYTTNLIS